MESDYIVILTGGTGTVKLIKGLNNLVPEKMVIITNTGDDFNYYGLKVSPDTDAVLYALSGQLDEQKMWGLKEDTFVSQKILKQVDVEEKPVAEWFNLGDKDLAYCLYRDFLLKKGKTFTEAVDIMKTKLQVIPAIFPMSNTEVTTFFDTTEGTFHFEEFFIKYHSEIPIKNIEYRNIEKAVPAEKLLELLSKAKLIIIGPSNPITSIGPILAIKKIKKAIMESKAKKIVISPIIGRNAYSGPAKIYMEAKGIEVSPKGVYDYYKDIGEDFYFDKQDEVEFKELLTKSIGVEKKNIYFEDILFSTTEKQINFAKLLLEKYS